MGLFIKSVFAVIVCSLLFNQSAVANPVLAVYTFVIRAAMPITEESELRDKCDFSSWAHIGMMKCHCNLSLKVACQKDNQFKESVLTGAGSARKRVFTEVCREAANIAKVDLEKSAYSFEKDCILSGGNSLKSGDIEFKK
mgnify:CR=1 FL=1